MAGITAVLTSHLLVDESEDLSRPGDSFLFLNVSSIEYSTSAGITQRVYADGQQEAIVGYGTQSPLTLQCEFMSVEDFTWLHAREGEMVLYRNRDGVVADVLINGVRQRERSTDDGTRETVEGLSPSATGGSAFGVWVQLFYVSTQRDRAIPTSILDRIKTLARQGA